ncbi:hypothetical protein XENOCAPTIV_004056, partial [Xenoophorus captivus]
FSKDLARTDAVGTSCREGMRRANMLLESRNSTVRTMWGGWGLAAVFTHHAIPLPGHSTVQSTVPTL